MTPARRALENAKACFLVAFFFALPISRPGADLILMALGFDGPLYIQTIGA